MSQNEIDEFKPLLQTLTKYSEQIKVALPKNTIDPSRILRMFISQVRKVPKLAYCDPVSVVGSIVRVAQLGIDPERAYLIPYKTECNVIIDYRGLAELVRRHPDMDDVYAYPVYKHDVFEIEMGSEPKLRHVPDIFADDKGKPIAYYSVGKFTNGFSRFEVMTREEVEAHRDKFATSKNSPAWKDSFDEMAKKTCIRKICKTLPTTSEVSQAEALEIEGAQHNHMVIDAEHRPSPNTSPDATSLAQLTAEDKAKETAENHSKMLTSVVERIDELIRDHGASISDIESAIGCKKEELVKLDDQQLGSIWEKLQ